jgi:hypothetical protein
VLTNTVFTLFVGMIDCVETKHFSLRQELMYLLDAVDEVRCKWG